MEVFGSLMNNLISSKKSQINDYWACYQAGCFHAKGVPLAVSLVLVAIVATIALGDVPPAQQSSSPATSGEKQLSSAASKPEFKPVLVKGIKFEGVSGKSVSTKELFDRPVSFFVETTKDGFLYREARDDAPKKEVRISDIGKDSRTSLDITALRAVATAASQSYQDRGIYAVRIDIMSDAVERLRQEGSDGILVILVTEGQVAKVGTVTRRTGEDKEGSDQADRNKPSHERIREKSPVQPGEPLNVPKVDDYVARLNRQPARHVEAEVRPGQKSGEVELDYLIMEQKPWLLYAQLDNTGTESTSELRERFGFRHYNLTGHDDILALDYVTDFQDVHYILGSYEFPIPGWDTASLKPFAGWSTYKGSELGIFNTEFSGQSFQVGGEFKTTILQRKRTFLDLLVGARYQHVEADNELAGTQGESGFVLPWVGLKLDSTGKYHQGSAGLTFELGVAGEDKDELALLGRSNVDAVWGVIRYDLSASAYLEPLLNAYFSGRGVHEIYGAVRGQVAPGGQRLTPSFMYPVGGFYSVRGYPESFASGDSSIVATLEYRLHLLDLLRSNNQTKSPNWDLILRGFLDAGHVSYNDPLSFEEDANLAALGVGFDLKIMRNFQCRLDLGVPLQAVDNGVDKVEAGDARLHFSISVSF